MSEQDTEKGVGEQITGLCHVGLSVSNLERALGFYRDLLGMTVLVEGPFGGAHYDSLMNLRDTRGTGALLQLGNLQMELFEFDHPVPRKSAQDRPVCDHGISHFCLSVSDIQAVYTRLEAAGVPFHCPPQETARSYATYGRDPDGNVFELLQLKPLQSGQ